jgi:hypothetical protein
LQIRVREDQEAVISSLAPSDFDCLLDLRPFMQRAPFVVNEEASLGRGYRCVAAKLLRAVLSGEGGRAGGASEPAAGGRAVSGGAALGARPPSFGPPGPPSCRLPRPSPTGPFISFCSSHHCRRLFRTMGLRHLFVGPPHPLVSGMITRKDIITGGPRCLCRHCRPVPFGWLQKIGRGC